MRSLWASVIWVLSPRDAAIISIIIFFTYRIRVVLPYELSLSIIAHSCDQQRLLPESEDGIGDVTTYAS